MLVHIAGNKSGLCMRYEGRNMKTQRFLTGWLYKVCWTNSTMGREREGRGLALGSMNERRQHRSWIHVFMCVVVS